MYKVTRCPVPPTTKDISLYRSLRLEAMQTDPSVFFSTLEREASLTDEQWRARLDSEDKATFLLSLSDEEWLGTITVLGPETLIQSMSQLPESLGFPSKLHMIVGMWIRPAHRQKGLGRRLVETGLDWARSSRSAEGDTWVVLQVNLDNGPARTLYEKMGFEPFREEDGKVVSDCRGEIEQIWMKCVV